jgi:cytochrome P450
MTANQPQLPRGYNFLQSAWRTYKQVKNPIGTMEESMARFGGTYSVNLGRARLIATQDPNFIDYVLRVNHRNYNKSRIVTEQLGRFIGNGLLTANGDYWLRQRRLIQPGFHQEKIHALFAIMRQTIDRFLASMPTGNDVDVYPLMNQLAFDIVVDTLFDVEVATSDRRDLGRFITETQDFVIRDIRQPYKSWWFSLSGEVKKYMNMAAEARNIVRKIIQARQRSGERKSDLLDMLLEARYEDDGQAMQEHQIIDEILILLIAGHETTANALSFALYLLANHPEEQLRLRRAVQSLSFDQVAKNEELMAVIYETMRLYPPAWISDRVAIDDDVFGEFHIPKGTIVVLFYYGLHRNDAFFDEASSFKPQRFAKEHIEKSKPKIFYPFGGGPRLCIGNNFALAEMAIFLREAITRFSFTPSKAPGIVPLVTLRPDAVRLGISPLV